LVFLGLPWHGRAPHTVDHWVLRRVGCVEVVGGWAGVGLVVVGGLFVEMCIVDASIFVVKLSRADGGCLGTRSR
jgi:hypothetical protein